ncbi:hypothetical protein ACFOYW_06100 [Gryllotalpicola reticulitermitis]|uniref:Fluoride ion transporter CrcB n=1 Tax=Gryllotalpicola reticulitermitis TaxID=1184153 RepID=A0ABV8Q3E4_9MICO
MNPFEITALVIFQLVFGAEIGVAIRLALRHLIAEEPQRIHLLLELIVAALLGALAAVPLLRDPASFLFVGYGVTAALIGYAVVCGVLARKRSAQRPRRAALSFAHAIASAAASTVGTLVVLAVILVH